MGIHNIDIGSFETKGSVSTEYKDNILYMTTTKKTSTMRFDRSHLKLDSYIYSKERYKLPLRIDLTVKIDTPGFYVFFGYGHVNFGTPWSDNRRIDDIVEPDNKPKSFNNYIPMNKFVEISIIYDMKEMQILVNGEERYYSIKEKYMKSALFNEMNTKGFEFKLTCDKRTDLYIKSALITEFEDTAGIMHITGSSSIQPQIEKSVKPTFESCISNLPDDIKAEIIKTDEFLKTLKPMRFKRQIEKHGNKITYLASEYGFSYAIYPSYDTMHHGLQWYIITSSKPELWHRKADMMEDTLNELSKTDIQFAQKMFDNLNECIGCCPNGCAVKTLYSFNGKKKVSCHGHMGFKMKISELNDVRKFISTVNKLNESNIV